MRNVSAQWKSQMENRRDFYARATITFSDGIVKEIQKADLMTSGNSIVTGANSSSFPLGVFVARQITLSLDNSNDQWQEYDFFGAKIKIYTNYQINEPDPESSEEFTPIIQELTEGTFTVINPETYGTTVEITAMDDSYLADKDYTSGLVFPQRVDDALRDCCKTCGITLYTTDFFNNDFEIQQKPENITCRQFIGYCAMIAGGNAILDEQNRLKIKSYNFTPFETVNNPDIPIVKDFKLGLKLSVDDVVITGLQIKATNESGEETAVQYGESGYVIAVENPLAIGNENEFVNTVGQIIVGARFRPFSGDHIADPLPEFMDNVYITDYKERIYQSVITDIDFSYFGITVLKCSADSPIRNSSKYLSSAVQAVQEARKLVEKEKSEREKAVERLDDAIKNIIITGGGGGVYITKQVQEDGSEIIFIHDQPTIELSTNVIAITNKAIGISNDGGKSYIYGFSYDGEAILRQIYAIGIDADYITAGSLSADRIQGGTLTLGGADNANGNLQIVDENGDVVGTWDNSGIELFKGTIGKLYLENGVLYSATANTENNSFYGFSNTQNYCGVVNWSRPGPFFQTDIKIPAQVISTQDKDTHIYNIPYNTFQGFLSNTYPGTQRYVTFVAIYKNIIFEPYTIDLITLCDNIANYFNLDKTVYNINQIAPSIKIRFTTFNTTTINNQSGSYCYKLNNGMFDVVIRQYAFGNIPSADTYFKLDGSDTGNDLINLIPFFGTYDIIPSSDMSDFMQVDDYKCGILLFPATEEQKDLALSEAQAFINRINDPSNPSYKIFTMIRGAEDYPDLKNIFKNKKPNADAYINYIKQYSYAYGLKNNNGYYPYTIASGGIGTSVWDVPNPNVGNDDYSWKFAVDSKGKIIAREGTFSGNLDGATGTFSGELQAATGSFKGNLNAATGTFSGDLSAAGGTFSGDISAATGTFQDVIASGNTDVSGDMSSNGPGIKIKEGRIFGYNKGENSYYGAFGTLMGLPSNRISSIGGVAFHGQYIGVKQSFTPADEGAAVDIGGSGKIDVVTGVSLNENGELEYTYKTLRFTNGIMTSAIDERNITPETILQLVNGGTIYDFYGDSVERTDGEQIVYLLNVGRNNAQHQPFPNETKVFDNLVYFVKRNGEWYISDILPTMTIHTYREVQQMEYLPRDEWAIIGRIAYYNMYHAESYYYQNASVEYSIQLYITDNSNCLDGYDEKLGENTVKVLQGVSYPIQFPKPIPFRDFTKENYSGLSVYPYKNVEIRYRDTLKNIIISNSNNPTNSPIKTTTTYIADVFDEKLHLDLNPYFAELPFTNYALALNGNENVAARVQNSLDNYSAPFFTSPKETPLYKCKIPLTKSCLIKFNSKADAQKIVDMFKEE